MIKKIKTKYNELIMYNTIIDNVYKSYSKNDLPSYRYCFSEFRWTCRWPDELLLSYIPVLDVMIYQYLLNYLNLYFLEEQNIKNIILYINIMDILIFMMI